MLSNPIFPDLFGVCKQAAAIFLETVSTRILLLMKIRKNEISFFRIDDDGLLHQIEKILSYQTADAEYIMYIRAPSFKYMSSKSLNLHKNDL